MGNTPANTPPSNNEVTQKEPAATHAALPDDETHNAAEEIAGTMEHADASAPVTVSDIEHQISMGKSSLEETMAALVSGMQEGTVTLTQVRELENKHAAECPQLAYFASGEHTGRLVQLAQVLAEHGAKSNEWRQAVASISADRAVRNRIQKTLGSRMKDFDPDNNSDVTDSGVTEQHRNYNVVDRNNVFEK